ncbi:GAF domain-containing protein [Streptomyces sp. NPDC052023]|uniref:GAF domain-containing protein n=1 Tax=Streptomyces sp. NPDC052023 TaxID=3365681 RepID=UPI0037CD39DA
MEFDAEDESMLSTLAVAAGVAVENARLYEETRLRERWSGASSEVTRALLSGAPSTDVLGLTVEQARQIADADAGMIAERVPEENALRPLLAVGLDAGRRSGLVMSGEDGFVAVVLTTAEPAVSVDIQEDARTSGDAAQWAGLGPVVGVPLEAGGKAGGVLLWGRAPGRTPFTDADTRPLLGFAGQAALALEPGRAAPGRRSRAGGRGGAGRCPEGTCGPSRATSRAGTLELSAVTGEVGDHDAHDRRRPRRLAREPGRRRVGCP